MRHFSALAVLLALFATAGCTHATATRPPDLLVSTDWLAKHLHDSNVTVIDVTDAATFEKGHIPGARLVPRKELTVDRNGNANEVPDDAALEKLFSSAGVPDHGPIIIYARELLGATRAFFTLEYAGRRGDAALLDGLFAKWSAENRPLETGPAAPKAAAFKVRADRNLIVTLDAMKKDAMASPSPVAIVDSRPAKNYDGSEAGEGIPRGGHIPGAVNVPFSTNLTKDPVPVFRPATELASLYRDAGVADGATVVTYCRSGMQATVGYFALRLLGRNVNLYDGSFGEWSKAADTPVVAK